jgi:hypothetical protein
VQIPAFALFDPAGEPVEGNGVAPDDPLAASAADIAARRDPILERGLRWAGGPP